MIYKNVELYNIEETVPAQNGNGVRLCRIPDGLFGKLNEGAQKAAYFCCGCEIRFVLKGDEAVIRLRRESVDLLSKTGVAEVYYGDFQAHYKITPCYIGEDTTEIAVPKAENLELLKEIAYKQGMRFNPEVVRIILPYDAGNVLEGVEGDVAPPPDLYVPVRRYLAYGSSITHGGSTVRPAGSYAMQAAGLLGADLINFGFAGSAHMEPDAADYIAQRKDWDFATLEMGVNVLGRWTPEQFQKRIDYFIERIAAANPDKWIFCIDLFLNDAYWKEDMKLYEFKRIIKAKVQDLKLPRLKYIPGEELLTQWQGLSSDLVHPSEAGFYEISRNLTDKIRQYIGIGGRFDV
ncbi:lysophospholipase L1-like esterase [Anaerotaenia torta]|uniref:GDSL-type esterase/lipase family protein n=1 Tax=Anaerotaenia torta TaxID=433293 RepID=UPI003D1DCD56